MYCNARYALAMEAASFFCPLQEDTWQKKIQRTARRVAFFCNCEERDNYKKMRRVMP